MAIIISTTSAMQTDFAHFCLKMEVLRGLNTSWEEPLKGRHVSTGAPVCVCVCLPD